MNFKEWIKLHEVGTMSAGITGGIGDIAGFKRRLSKIVRRKWPINLHEDSQLSSLEMTKIAHSAGYFIYELDNGMIVLALSGNRVIHMLPRKEMSDLLKSLAHRERSQTDWRQLTNK